MDIGFIGLGNMGLPMARIEDDDAVSGLNEPPCHGQAHIAETNEADVHGIHP